MISNELHKLFNELELQLNESVFDFDNQGDWNSFITSETKKKLEIIKPDALYIFNKQPYILFFDLTNKENKKRIKDIHKKVWSFDQTPIVIFVYENNIEFYNAFEYDRKLETLIEIKDKDEAIKNCNFWELQSGQTLEWLYNKYKSSIIKKRVNQQLFENIKQTIEWFTTKFDLDDKKVKILILRIIFIRYLIDRNIRIDTSFILGSDNSIFERRKSFSDLIAKPKRLQEFFNYLNHRFNGVLFKNSSLQLNEEQSQILSKLFDPNGISKSETLDLFSGSEFETEFKYEVFDFGIIPVELISGIYESILDQETKNATSAIYTPPFLVDYVLNQTLDKFFEENSKTIECKVFDPAMGSGIFVVQALRRMIDRELILNPNSDNKIFGERIREIAENNLFGIDINEEAINVACFSIYVALLDYQNPGDIDDYHFPNLVGKNFFRTNFFIRETNVSDSEIIKIELSDFKKNLDIINRIEFDFILGNAPWKRDKSDYHIGWLKENDIYEKINLGEKEIALSYLMRVNDFMNPKTICSLIVTSTIFYNVSNTIRQVKSKFFNNYSIQSVLDLSPVRRLVFDGEKIVEKIDSNGRIKQSKQKIVSPALIVQFQKYNSDFSESNPIHFKSIKPNRFFNKLSKNLVIEKFDSKKILQKYFVENQWMFKVALYGNILDYFLLKKLDYANKLSNTISEYNIKKRDGLKRDVIFKRNKEYNLDLEKLIIEKVDILPVFTNSKNINNISNKNLTDFAINLFGNYKIILKGQTKNETNIVISYHEGIGVFRNDSFLLYSDNNNIEVPYSYLISKIYTYYIFLISSTWGIATRPAIRLDDEYLSFPFIEPTINQKEILISLVNQLLKPYKVFYQEYPNKTYQGNPNESILNQINEVIYNIYDIKGHERDLIDYLLNVSRYQFQESKQHLVSNFNDSDHRNRKLVLEQYSDVFIKEFEKIYKDDNLIAEVYEMNNFITIHFIFTKKESKKSNKINFVKEINSISKLFGKLSSLSISSIASSTNSDYNLFIQKDIKGFEQDSFYIIKPAEYKCWHRAMAWYDVAEFKESIEKAEIDYLKQNMK